MRGLGVGRFHLIEAGFDAEPIQQIGIAIALARLVAATRILMPRSVVRLSAGRQYMTDELQALCFLAGANSIFIGDVLLTTRNPQRDRDTNLLDRLGVKSRLNQVKSTNTQHAHD